MPPENLNAAGPHGPLIRQPLASSLRFRTVTNALLCCHVSDRLISTEVHV
jgi:hypothetical protein